MLDRYLATAGYTGQLTDKPTSPGAPANLFEAVPGDYSAHGRFDDVARATSSEMILDRHKLAFLALASIAIGAILHQIAKRNRTI